MVQKGKKKNNKKVSPKRKNKNSSNKSVRQPSYQVNNAAYAPQSQSYESHDQHSYPSHPSLYEQPRYQNNPMNSYPPRNPVPQNSLRPLAQKSNDDNCTII